MAASAAEHLQQSYSLMSIRREVAQAVETSLLTVRQKVSESMMRPKRSQSRQTHNVSLQTDQKRLINSGSEDREREDKLKDAIRKKRELEDKLTFVTETIHRLSPPRERSVSRCDLRSKSSRQRFLSEEQAKRREASTLTQRLHREQLETMRRKELRLREEEDRRRKEEMEEERQKEAELRQKEEQKAKHIVQIQVNILKRKHSLEAHRQLMQAELVRLQRQSYVEDKLMHDFKERFLDPRETERQEALARKKELYKPISKEELETHAKKYDEEVRRMREKMQRKSQKPSPEVPCSLETSHRSLLCVKRKKYGELVKSFFRPAIDPLKQKEIELIKERMKTHVKIAVKQDRESPILFKPKKFRPNSMIPPVKEKRSPKNVDFLSELRKQREHEMRTEQWETELRTGGKSLDDITRNVKKVEKLMNRKAMLLKHADMTDSKALEGTEKVDEALLGTIKAKLNALESL